MKALRISFYATEDDMDKDEPPESEILLPIYGPNVQPFAESLIAMLHTLGKLEYTSMTDFPITQEQAKDPEFFGVNCPQRGFLSYVEHFKR